MDLARALLAAAAVSFAATPVVRAVAHRFGALDVPGPRKAHRVPRPRLGGVAVALGWTVGVVLAALGPASAHVPPWNDVRVLIGAGLLVFATGLIDDLRGLAPLSKLAAEALVAVMVVAAGVSFERVTLFGVTVHAGVWGPLLSVAWIVVVTNAVNMMDGIDGLATGLAIIAGVTCTAISITRGEYATAAVLAPLVGALVGFLPFNFSPASIFLGDSGSLLAGFVLATTAITGAQKGATVLAAGLPVLVFALPILDLCAAVARRMAGRPGAGGRRSLAAVLRPDQGHLHHRLLAVGLSQRQVAMLLYLVSGALSVIALLTMDS